MLSICIPVYNSDLTELIHELTNQAASAKIEFEIILIDDASNAYFRTINSILQKIKWVSYIQLEQNIGRAAIRNKLAGYAKFPYLLFLDSDSEIKNDSFINSYLKHLSAEEKIICGGRTYGPKPKRNKLKLRWKYGLKRECVMAEERSKNMYRSFMTNNFVIAKSIFERVRFEEKLKRYGHEDTLFGYRLKQNGISVLHINNMLGHHFTETSREYLKKTRFALKNLQQIKYQLDVEEGFQEMVKLLRVYSAVKKWYLHIPIAIFHFLFLPFIRLYFFFGFTSLKIFDFYKFGYYCTINIFRKNS